MTQKYAWYDPHTTTLIGWGYMIHREADGSESFPHVPVSDDFALQPGDWYLAYSGTPLRWEKVEKEIPAPPKRTLWERIKDAIYRK